MKTINHKQLVNVIKVGYETKTPLFIWGTIGIGKSTIVKDVAKHLAKKLGCKFKEGETNGGTVFSFIDVRISQLEPSDLRGLPNIDTKTNTTQWVIPNWLPRSEDSKGILFFDELNLAPPSIQASAYQLILDRRLGDYKLPDGWVIISAGNTAEDRANIFDLPSPLANRFAHITLAVPDKEAWVEWALNNGIDTDLIAFIEFKPSYLYKFDRRNKDKAFPTPRSWEYASRLVKDRKLSLSDKDILVSSAVGEAIATEFIAFQRLQSKINIKDILKNPASVEKITEIDLKYSLLSAIVEEYKKDKKHLKEILEVCNHLPPEFAILLLRFLNVARYKNQFKRDVIKLTVWKELASKYGKYLIDLKEDD
ncbi:MAG: hypothetical protein KAJ49_05930 [Arcobacteraceae bacterium]|nr:hypothetical protein [Arcobacteraceae bacterium]